MLRKRAFRRLFHFYGPPCFSILYVALPSPAGIGMSIARAAEELSYHYISSSHFIVWVACPLLLCSYLCSWKSSAETEHDLRHIHAIGRVCLEFLVGSRTVIEDICDIQTEWSITCWIRRWERQAERPRRSQGKAILIEVGKGPTWSRWGRYTIWLRSKIAF